MLLFSDYNSITNVVSKFLFTRTEFPDNYACITIAIGRCDQGTSNKLVQ